jgi:poly(ADP-ribose) glycohydrolase ARH3
MQVAPIALLAFKEFDRVEQLATQSALITHAHPLGIEGAVLQAYAIALLLQLALLLQPEPETHSMIIETFLTELCRPGQSPYYRNRLRRIVTLLPDATPEDVVIQLGHGVAAYEAVPAAFYAFLRSPESFSETIHYAIHLGGDTDTIASMAGALAGAYLGEEAIPIRWRDNLEDAQRLRHLADALFVLATPGEAPTAPTHSPSAKIR